MQTGQLVLTLISAAALATVGLVALLRPHVLQDAARAGTRGTRDIAILNRVWYDWARSRYYVGTVRLLGTFALAMAVFLLSVVLNAR